MEGPCPARVGCNGDDYGLLSASVVDASIGLQLHGFYIYTQSLEVYVLVTLQDLTMWIIFICVRVQYPNNIDQASRRGHGVGVPEEYHPQAQPYGIEVWQRFIPTSQGCSSTGS